MTTPIIVITPPYDRIEPKKVIAVGGLYLNATEDLKCKVASAMGQEGKEIVGQDEFLHLATAVDQETEDQLQVGSTRDAQELFSPPTIEIQSMRVTSTNKKV